jgi:hypothetical protein
MTACASEKAGITQSWRVAGRTSVALRGLACAAALAGASTVHAATFNYPGGFFTGGDSGLAGYDYSNIASMPALGNIYTGGDQLNPVSPSGPAILAWCVDLSDSIYVGSTNVGFNVLSDSDPTTVTYFSGLYTGANGATTITNLEHLASNWLSSVTNADTSAAFQIAVWDIAFEGGSSTFAVANGANKATVNADVTLFLGNLSGPITEKLTYLQDNGANMGTIQNLATFTAVPLPAALPLLLSGFIGLGSMARRRKSA